MARAQHSAAGLRATLAGDRGPDDHGEFRHGLAECMLIGRPVQRQQHQAGPAEGDEDEELVTILPHETLTQFLPTE